MVSAALGIGYNHAHVELVYEHCVNKLAQLAVLVDVHLHLGDFIRLVTIQKQIYFDFTKHQRIDIKYFDEVILFAFAIYFGATFLWKDSLGIHLAIQATFDFDLSALWREEGLILYWFDVFQLAVMVKLLAKSDSTHLPLP